MARFLFAATPVWSHINPTIAIAQRLQEAGHRVAYACHADFERFLSGAGLELLPGFPWGVSMLRAQRLMAERSNRWLALMQATRGLPTEIYFQDLDQAVQMLIDIARSWKPDLLVTDMMLHAGPIAAEACQLPYATTCTLCLPVIGPDLPPYGFGLPPAARRGWKWRMGKVVLAAILRSGDRSINRVRGRLGLPSRKASFFSYSPYLVLGFTTEAFEYSGARLPSQVYLVGPSTSKKRGDLETDFPWEWLDGKPALYATLGTLNTGRTLFYEKVIEACRGEPWQMVVSVGRSLSLKTRDVPENVLLREYVPQPELLSRVSGVVCHGGNVTVAETLSAGLPLVVVPIGADQPEVAQRVVEAGAGLRLGMRRLTVPELRRAMRRLLEDSSLKANAGRIAEDYGRCDGPGVSAGLLVRLAEERVPILRGPECRATVYAGGAGDIFGDQSG